MFIGLFVYFAGSLPNSRHNLDHVNHEKLSPVQRSSPCLFEPSPAKKRSISKRDAFDCEETENLLLAACSHGECSEVTLSARNGTICDNNSVYANSKMQYQNNVSKETPPSNISAHQLPTNLKYMNIESAEDDHQLLSVGSPDRSEEDVDFSDSVALHAKHNLTWKVKCARAVVSPMYDTSPSDNLENDDSLIYSNSADYSGFSDSSFSDPNLLRSSPSSDLVSRTGGSRTSGEDHTVSVYDTAESGPPDSDTNMDGSTVNVISADDNRDVNNLVFPDSSG